jgi:L-ascorbate metabolism protein UlaG (beta-lactamase superfamily)
MNIARLHREPCLDLRRSIAEPVSSGQVRLWWLGQAGFVLKTADAVLVIDPYLSDSLAKKYAEAEFKHLRMMPPPIKAKDLKGIDLVLASHRHSDHMDPDTLPVLAENNPRCHFVVPRSEAAYAAQLGVPRERTVGLNAGETFVFDEEVSVEAIPSAHEEIKTNDGGEHLYLGYLLKLDGINLYHSGDCVPYPGLCESLTKRDIQFALLPLNGRDAYRTERNIIGNFTVSEAINLCVTAGIPNLIGHHYGLFDFNTISEEAAERAFTGAQGKLTCILARAGVTYTLFA